MIRNSSVLLMRIAGWLLVGLVVAKAARAPEQPRRSGWRVLYAENFDAAWSSDERPWNRQNPDAPPLDGVDDDGAFFHAIGGSGFSQQRRSFATFRKSIPFGQNQWLTLELSGRGDPADTAPEDGPWFRSGIRLHEQSAGLFVVPEHHGGILIRPTNALPSQYRVEVTFLELEFGGTRGGVWEDSSTINGYRREDRPKTSHPWTWGPGPIFEEPDAKWPNATIANGFYFLTIVDYPNPAPRNNVFIHTHRKVGIDTYNVLGTGDGRGGYDVCDVSKHRYYQTNDNTVNAIFFSTGSILQSRAIMETPCGTVYGNEDGYTEVASVGQMEPEVLPGKPYQFAIERDPTGYTLEMTGYFRFAGFRTYRFHRRFIEQGRPIWHYNRTWEEYDGRFDEALSFQGPFGVYAIPHSWPKGSSFPDYFIIGDPHTNYYEGRAAITRLRLMVPAEGNTLPQRN